MLPKRSSPGEFDIVLNDVLERLTPLAMGIFLPETQSAQSFGTNVLQTERAFFDTIMV
jgi:hypothetical protein